MRQFLACKLLLDRSSNYLHILTMDSSFIRIVGTFCVAIPMVLNGAIGAKLHVPFSVITTGSFGYYFRYFCIVSRAILAMFWFGIQGANGRFVKFNYD